MALSKEIRGVLLDLVEIKLSCMQVSDREDMREMMILQRCVSELNGEGVVESGMAGLLSQVPKRGRRRRAPVQVTG